jgi:arylsulfatase A-like enzyme
MDDNNGHILGPVWLLGLMPDTRRVKGSCYEVGFRVTALAWRPGHIKPASVIMDMFSHLDWWPTFPT